ncbi:MAG: hypothetical protein AAF433_22205 [Bacteroidota bacterium]
MRYFLRLLYYISVFSFLSILTQIGGLIWVIVRLSYRTKHLWRRRAVYVLAYLVATFLVVPQLAKVNGRTSLPMGKSGDLRPHTYWTVLLNRQYVSREMYQHLMVVAEDVASNYPGTSTSYLDGNFPFWDGFPLLPHISHNDGKKVDLAFHYRLNGEATNAKPAFSGYGAYVEPSSIAGTRLTQCKAAGYWQYDFSKYLSFGRRNDLELDVERTRNLIQELIREVPRSKILLEPHLRQRMGLSADRVRWQGCHSVRHDDHLHWEIP